MKAEELMIGDWVCLEDENLPLEERYFKIEYLAISAGVSWVNQGTNAPIGLGDGESLIPVFRDEISPIPLTPEILKKNGFENVDNMYPFPTFRCDDKENYLCITIGFPEGDKTKRKRTFIEIDGIHIYIGHLIINFVHELQHTLKLCGIDKEIII